MLYIWSFSFLWGTEGTVGRVLVLLGIIFLQKLNSGNGVVKKKTAERFFMRYIHQAIVIAGLLAPNGRSFTR